MLKCPARLAFIGHAVEILGEHDVLDGGEMRDQVILLENQPNGLGAEAYEGGAAELRDVGGGDADGPGGRLIEAAEDIQQRGFAGTGRAHDGDPPPRPCPESYVVQAPP